MQGAVDKVVVLFIGKTGHGKSRLINMILQEAKARSYPSTESITKNCKAYEFSDTSSRVHYHLIDTMGLADTEESDEVVVGKIKDFFKTEYTEVHYVVIVVKGEKLTQENVGAIGEIIGFLGLDGREMRGHVILCVTHTDGWNASVKDRYSDSLQAHPVIEKLTRHAPLNIVWSGAPDPGDMEDEEDREYAKRKERAMRTELLSRLAPTETTILGPLIRKWRNLEAEELRREIAELKSKQQWCSLF